jgi:hypothetical protein
LPNPNTGPEDVEPPAAPSLPGHFVSPEHRSDCERFLDEVKDLVRRRREAGQDKGPPSRRLS